MGFVPNRATVNGAQFLAAAILDALLVVASVALAASVPKPGKVSVYATPRAGNSGADTIVITGRRRHTFGRER